MEQYAVYNDPAKGPVFGQADSPDLGIGDRANESETKYSFVGKVFHATSGLDTMEKTLDYFCESPGFIPSIVELFYQGNNLLVYLPWSIYY